MPQEQGHNGNESTEGRVKEEETPAEPPTLPLKHGGGRANVRRALIKMQYLQAMLDTHPDRFEALLALARGKKEGISQAGVDGLRAECLVAKDSLAVDPEIRDILLSGYQYVGDGHCMGYPFVLDTPESRRIVETVERQVQEGWAGMVFGGDKKGRSR